VLVGSFFLVVGLCEHVSIYLSMGCSRKWGPSVHESPPEPLLGRIEQVFLPSSTPDWRLPTPESLAWQSWLGPRRAEADLKKVGLLIGDCSVLTSVGEPGSFR